MRMGRMTSTIQQLAKQIVDYEAQLALEPLSQIEVVMRVCEKLRLHLSTLVGNAGYHALVTRALVLLARDYPWAESYHIQENGSIKLEMPPAIHLQPGSLANEAVAIPAQLLTLLAIFIGETLTLTLAREIWPIVPSNVQLKKKKVK